MKKNAYSGLSKPPIAKSKLMSAHEKLAATMLYLSSYFLRDNIIITHTAMRIKPNVLPAVTSLLKVNKPPRSVTPVRFVKL